MDKVAGQLAEFKADCGFDPIESIKSIAIGMKNIGGGGEPDGAVVIHGPDKAKVMACVDKEKDKAEGRRAPRSSVDGDVVVDEGQDRRARPRSRSSTTRRCSA